MVGHGRGPLHCAMMDAVDAVCRQLHVEQSRRGEGGGAMGREVLEWPYTPGGGGG